MSAMCVHFIASHHISNNSAAAVVRYIVLCPLDHYTPVSCYLSQTHTDTQMTNNISKHTIDLSVWSERLPSLSDKLILFTPLCVMLPSTQCPTNQPAPMTGGG